jgi:hypothetical protein
MGNETFILERCTESAFETVETGLDEVSLGSAAEIC